MRSLFAFKEVSFLRAVAALSGLIVLVCIMVFRPFWGLMDDHYNIFHMVPEMQREGVFSYAWAYAIRDLDWGMFRPTNPLMVYLLYRPVLNAQPWVLFAWNAVISFFILYLAARVFSKIMDIGWWPIAVLYGGFFYLHDLFQFPSLQEKMIVLFGSLLLLCVGAKKRTSLQWALIVLCAVLGTLVKASFLIYFSMAVWLEFWREDEVSLKQRIKATLPLAGLLLLATLFSAYVTKGGGYTTERYSVSKILPNLFSANGLMFGLPLVVLLALFFFGPKQFRHPRHLTTGVGLAAFLTIFSPWGIAAYIQTVAAPFFCALLIYLFGRLCPARARGASFIVMAIFCLGVTTYRSVVNFQRLGDLGRAVASSKEWEARGVSEIFMPCSEGSVAMRGFFSKISGANIKVTELAAPSASDMNGKYLFFDQGLCPLPRRVAMVEGCRSELIFRGSFSKSFKLAQLSCP